VSTVPSTLRSVKVIDADSVRPRGAPSHVPPAGGYDASGELESRVDALAEPGYANAMRALRLSSRLSSGPILVDATSIEN
jgi:hypothetical protein